MLRILLFVPQHIDAVQIDHDLVSGLAKSYPEGIDVQLCIGGEHDKAYSLNEFDIIHFFGCWSHAACLLAHKAHAHGVPYILTPLGCLQPWETKKRGHSILAKRQQRLVGRAAAIQVCGKLEYDNFVKLGWNKRVAMVKNPVLTSQITFETAAKQMRKLYRKVIDSNAQLCLNHSIRELIGTLLQIGMDDHADTLNQDLHETSLSEFSQNLGQMSMEDWRRLLIYCHQEHIIGIMSQALDKLHVSYPSFDMASIEKFEPKSNYVEGSLCIDSLLSKNLLLRNTAKDVFENNGIAERQLCMALLNLHHELSRHVAPLSHLLDVYSMVRFKDVDEDLVNDMVRQLGIREFAQSLTGVMDTFLGLPDGFWIFKPKYGQKTEKLINEVTKFGHYNY